MAAPFQVSVFMERGVAATGATAGAGAGPALVGRVQAQRVETAEWPATVGRPLTAADLPGGTALSASLDDRARWMPATAGRYRLAPALWIAGALAALAALFLRR
jgi:hypothetical protein